MSDAIQYIEDVDSEEFEDAPRALRDAYKKLVKAHKAEVEASSTLRGQLTSRAVTDVLADKQFKNPDRVKQALLADKIDPLDSSAVETWLTANGDDYAKATQTPGNQEQQSATVTPEEQQAYRNLGLDGVQPEAQGMAEKLAKVSALVTKEMTGADVEKLYREHGI